MTESSPPHVDLAIAGLAARQHGVVSLEQLVGLGLTPSAVRMRVKRGRLHVVRRGVYSLSPVLTRGARELAAVFASRGALSHRSAADWLGVRPTSRPVIEVSIPRGTRRALPGIQIHEARQMETATVDGIPCTTLAQTLLDLCEVLRPFHVRKAITRAEHLRIFDLSDVERVLAAANGRLGAPILRSLLADFDPVETESEIEDLLSELCEANDLPRPTEQYWIGDYRADFAWPKERVIAEVDDWQTHGTRSAFEKDRRRVQDLMPEWRVVPITYRQLTDEPARIADVLKRLLTP